VEAIEYKESRDSGWRDRIIPEQFDLDLESEKKRKEMIDKVNRIKDILFGLDSPLPKMFTDYGTESGVNMEMVVKQNGKWNDKLLDKLIEDWKSFGWKKRLSDKNPGDERFHIANIVLNYLFKTAPGKYKQLSKKHSLIMRL